MKLIIAATLVKPKDLNACYKLAKKHFGNQHLRTEPDSVVVTACNKLNLPYDMNVAA